MKKILLIIPALILSVSGFSQVKWGVKAGVGISNYGVSMENFSPSIRLGKRVGFYVGGVNTFCFSDRFALQTELMYANQGTRACIGNDVARSLITTYLAIGGATPDPAFLALIDFKDNFIARMVTHDLRMPILLKFKTTEGLNIMAGPYISYRVGLNLSIKNANQLSKLMGEETIQPQIDMAESIGKDLFNDNLKKFDMGLAFGAEYFVSKHIVIDVRYNLGLLNNIKKDLDLSIVDPSLTSVNVKERFGLKPTVRNSSLNIGASYIF